MMTAGHGYGSRRLAYVGGAMLRQEQARLSVCVRFAVSRIAFHEAEWRAVCRVSPSSALADHHARRIAAWSVCLDALMMLGV